MEINISSLRDFFLGLQDRITTRIASVDGKPFIEDAWVKAEDSPLQGDGRSRLLEGGNIFERAGVGFSHVRGNKLPPSATQNRPELAGWALRQSASPWSFIRATPISLQCT